MASRIDGSREALRDGALGLLVDPRDREEVRRGILATLKASRGRVPEGLKYFAFPRFEQRCHEVLDDLLFGSERTVTQNARTIQARANPQ